MNAPEIIEALGALAHEHRLAAFRLLVERGPAGLNAGTIADVKVASSSMPPTSRQ
jgi:ArsR family transcriptional regulator